MLKVSAHVKVSADLGYQKAKSLQLRLDPVSFSILEDFSMIDVI